MSLAEQIAEKHKLDGLHIGRYDANVIAALKEVLELAAQEAEKEREDWVDGAGRMALKSVAARIRKMGE